MLRGANNTAMKPSLGLGIRRRLLAMHGQIHEP